MEGFISKESDVFFALWTKKVEPTLCKLNKEGLELTDSVSTLFAWWDIIGKNGKKSKRGDIIEALNYMCYSKLRNVMSEIPSIIKARCEEFDDVQKSEAEKSEAKILDLKLQLDNLLAEQLALAEKCKSQKDTIADLKAMLKTQKFVSPKMLNSDGIKKHVHFSDEVTCNESEMICSEAVAKKSLPVSVIKVMPHHSAAKTHGVEALESLKNPQTSDDHSNQPSGKQNRLCMTCKKFGHREEQCWTSGQGRSPPYFLRKRKSLKSKNQWSSRNKNSSDDNTLSELTALLIQGLQLLTSFASGLAA